jgi:hypothetical protein
MTDPVHALARPGSSNAGWNQTGVPGRLYLPIKAFCRHALPGIAQVTAGAGDLSYHL